MIQRRRPIESAIAERKMFNMGGMAASDAATHIHGLDAARHYGYAAAANGYAAAAAGNYGVVPALWSMLSQPMLTIPLAVIHCPWPRVVRLEFCSGRGCNWSSTTSNPNSHFNPHCNTTRWFCGF